MFGRYMQPWMIDDHILIYICISAMNDFPVIRDPCFARSILGSPGGNIASRYKEMYGVELFLR